MVRREADISTAGLSVTLERSADIDYAVGITRHAVGLLVPHHQAAEVNYWVFAQVFRSDLWKGEVTGHRV